MEFNATFIISAISFILFTMIMNKIFYKPIGNIIKERQKFIDDTMDAAKKSDFEADNILKERDSKLSESLQNSKKIISDKTVFANEKATEMLIKARENSRIKISEAKNNLLSESDNLSRNLEPKIDDLSDLIVSKIFEEAEN